MFALVSSSPLTRSLHDDSATAPTAALGRVACTTLSSFSQLLPLTRREEAQEVVERAGEGVIRQLGFDELDGFFVDHDQKVDLALLLVAKETQRRRVSGDVFDQIDFSRPELVGEHPVEATDIKRIILDHVFA